MKRQLVRLKTKDKKILHGLLYSSKNGSIVIHLHGLQDNFYELPFIDAMAREYAKVGFDFFPFNNRGHDFYSQSEKFTDCILDIDAAIQFAKKSDYKNIVLQGHSTGATKLAYYTQKRKAKIQGLILLGAISDAEILSKDKKKHTKLIREAKRLVGQKKGKKYLSEEVFGWPITAQRYVSLATFGGKEDPFSFSYGIKRKNYKGITSPTLIVFGENDKYATRGVKEHAQAIENVIKAETEKLIISKADHNFSGKQKALAIAIAKWLKSLTN